MCPSHLVLLEADNAFPFKVSSSDYKELTEEGCTYVPAVEEYCDFDTRLLAVETNLTVVAVWGEVRKSVTRDDYDFLVKRFRDRVKYNDLAAELGVTVTSLKARQRRLLSRLRNNARLKQIARDCFGI